MRISPIVGRSQAQQAFPRSLVDLSSFARSRVLTVTFIHWWVENWRYLAMRRVCVKCEWQPANTCWRYWENARQRISELTRWAYVHITLYLVVSSHRPTEPGTFQQDACPVCLCASLPPLSSWPCLISISRWDPRAPLCHSLPRLQVCHFILISQMPSLPPCHGMAQMKLNEVSRPFCRWM